MTVQRHESRGDQETDGKLKRRGILAAAALAVGILATKGVQPVAAVFNSDYFTASGGSGSGSTAYSNASTGYDHGVVVSGNVYGVAGISVNGNGVEGHTTSGYGVWGLSGNIGVRGEDTSGTGTGVQGVGGGYGVHGSAPGSAPGVYGESGGGAGVSGRSSSGIGVQGTNTNGIGVYGISGGGSYPYGVVGATTAPGIALYGVAGVAGAVGFAAGAGVAGAIAGQFSGNVNFYGGGGSVGNTVTLNGANLVVANGGTKNAAVKVADGSFRLLHCVEAPEPWFEDFGEASLSGGKAEVKLDPVFASTIDTGTLHVFCMPHDPSHHLAVTTRSGSGFSVAAGVSGDAAARGLKAGDVSGTFTWRVVGKRKDVSGERLAKFDLPKEITFAPPPIPQAPPPTKKGA